MNDKHLSLRLRRVRARKVISLSRHACTCNREEDKERFRAATTRYRPTRGQTRATRWIEEAAYFRCAAPPPRFLQLRFSATSARQMLSGYGISYLFLSFYSIRCVVIHSRLMGNKCFAFLRMLRDFRGARASAENEYTARWLIIIMIDDYY